MKFDPQKHHRRSYRLQSHDYSSAAAYFVTIVAKNRECLFGDVAGEEMVFSPLGKIADEFFCAIPEHFPNVDIDVHQVMPNHAHGIIVIHDTVGATHTCPEPQVLGWVAPTGKQHGPKQGSIGAILGSYKMAVTRQAIARFEIAAVWQRNYYDRIIRNEKEWHTIRDYILSNPAKWLQDQEKPRK